MLAYVPSLIQVLLVEMLGALLGAVLVATIAARRGAIGCPGDPEIAFGALQIGAVALGVLMIGWMLYRILWPTIIRVSLYNQIKLFFGNLHVTVPTGRAGTIGFPSTHPAYAGAEAALFIFFVVPLFALGTRGEFVGCSLQYSFVYWWTVVALLFAFPLLRLLAWYGLRRRYPNADENAYADRVASMVYWPLAIAVPCALFLFGSVWLPRLWATRVDAVSFAGGLARRAALDGAMVKVRGRLMEPPRTCACAPGRPKACYVADARLDLGEGGEVIVRGLSDFAATVLILAEAGTEREISAYGKLTRAPKPAGSSVPCPADPFPPTNRPRAYLDVW